MNSIEELVADPQCGAAGGVVEIPDGASTTSVVASPADFLGTPIAHRWTAPELGQHTDEVLGELRHRGRRRR